MARPLVVEGEAAAGVADLADRFVEAQPLERRRRRVVDGRGRAIHRLERVEREQVLDVGEDELLMLLLVMQPELDDLRGRVDLGHALVDVRAVAHHLVDGRSRQKAARRAIPARADGLVVRVEQVVIARVERLVAGARRQHEGLEEPGRVRQVPFDRATVGHRLRDEILDGEATTKLLGGAAYVAVGLPEVHTQILSRSSEIRLIGSDIRTIRDMSPT